ncbi:hypothetical protein DRO69_09230 [Candidatus Bathyarchaeota archaeon]|nr:MAG: hypothetical protein DRO69_09230 [Candidatus Bathyarchaeota archaeon]
MSIRVEEEVKAAEQALATLPEEARKAISEFTMMSISNIPEDQRDLIKARLASSIIAALPVAQRELKFKIEDFIRPTKMVSGKYTVVELRPEMYNLTTFRYNWTATGEQSCPWNVTTPETIVMIIVGFQNPEPSPKTRYVYGKIGVDDLPVYYVGDLEGFRVKVLPQPYILKPRTSIELKQYIEATGYDEFKPFGAAIVPAVEATKRAPWTF